MNSPAFYGKLKANLHREAKKVAALPMDPFILCADLQVDRAALEAQLAAIGMTYDPSQNKFL